MRNYIFLGPPGAGKGTMAAILADKEQLQHISTGDILRAEIKNQTQLGQEAKDYINKGQLVPDEVVTAIVAGRLTASEAGNILDGFPRTTNQGQLLEQEFESKDLELDAAALFEVGREELLQRLTGRRICRECGAVYHVKNMPPKEEGRCDKCGGELYQRPDDSEDTVQDRLKVYEEQTAPLIDFYKERGKLVRVRAEGGKDSNFKSLCEALGL